MHACRASGLAVRKSGGRLVKQNYRRVSAALSTLRGRAGAFSAILRQAGLAHYGGKQRRKWNSRRGLVFGHSSFSDAEQQRGHNYREQKPDPHALARPGCTAALNAIGRNTM
jgi:hypothetical protein